MKSLQATRTAGGNGPRPPAGNGGGSGGSREEATPAATARVGVWFFLTAVTMLFTAFTVSYAARRTAPDWTPMALPPILWVNTGLLVASSATLEWARRRGRRGDAAGVRGGLTVTTLLGAAFLVGQITAWRELAAAGLFMATSPHSAFFHLLTAVHGLHLLGGLGALGYALRRTAATAPAGTTLAGEEPPAAVLGSVTIYWHFLTALWLYVFFIIWS
jgi:cytochrome c oxidase subunit 3